jgi:exonuclease SbcD
MFKLLYAGDPHVKGSNPRNRIDNYKDTVFAKIREIFQLSKDYDCKGIVFPGDVLDSPEISNLFLVELAGLLDESPCPIYTTIGNHEMYGYNIETYIRTSLRILSMLVPKLHVVTILPVVFEHNPRVCLTFTPYSGRIDIGGYGYSPESLYMPNQENMIRVHVAHGMALDHRPPFDRYTLIQEVKTEADLVITGHDHTGYGIYKRADGKVFLNPGSITRLSASITEMTRPVQVALITFNDNQRFEIDLVPLESAKPGEEVLDRSIIETRKQQEYAMEQFTALIQNSSGKLIKFNINDAVQEIAKKKNIPPEIVQMALDKIDLCRAVK